MNATELVQSTIEYVVVFMARRMAEAGYTEEQAAAFLLSAEGQAKVAVLAGQFMDGATRLAVERKV